MDKTADHSPADPDAEAASLPVRRSSVPAFAVHVLTACGAALCFLGLLAAVSANWPLMFAWLGLALIIDAVDGTLARRFQVRERLPRWSGDTLDLVVDYLGYVFVPVYAIVAGELLPDVAAIPAGLLILVTSALYFADRQMKMADNHFRGFPALWNVVAFYLFLLRPPPWLAVAVVVALCGASFAPFPFLHPLRVARLRRLNIALVLAWAGLAVAAVIQRMEPGIPVKLALVALAVYFVTAGLLPTREPNAELEP